MGMKVNGTSGLTFPDTTTLASAGQASVRAWVNFNGTGTVAIRAAYNVTSITDGGVGQYTVNFTTALPDANYAMNATAWQETTDDANGPFTGYRGSSNPLTSTSASIRTAQPGGAGGPPAYVDCAGVYVSVFR